MYYLTVLKLEVQRQGVDGVSCGWFLPRAVSGNVFHASSLASSAVLAIFGTPWFRDLSPDCCLPLHVTFPYGVRVCVQIPPFYKDTSHGG